MIRDNRKIDREQAAAAAAETASATGTHGDGSADGGTAPEGIVDDGASPADSALTVEAPDENAVLLEERTRDLQRLQAEYANYRKRSERDRLAAGDSPPARCWASCCPSSTTSTGRRPTATSPVR